MTENPESPEKDAVTISNDLSSIGGLSLDGVIARITGIAEIVNQRKALYDRSAAIAPDGTIPAKRLEGTIDVLRTRLSSAISNWYTDNNGNLILEAVNGNSAMQLCGDGFMIANQKTDDGKWDWRTFGTGEGFTADMIVTGFLSADRIGAHTITANKLAADVGESLDLSSNKSITETITQNVEEALEDIEIGGVNLIEGSAAYTLIAGGADSYWIAADELESGKTYTLSVQEIELVEGQAPGVTWKIFNRDTNTEQLSGMLEITYGRQATTFTLPEEDGNWALYLYAGESGNTMGNTVVFRKIKLEEGTVATAWSFSTDELSSSIGELTGQVEELDDTMESRVMMLIDALGLSEQYASAEEFLKALADIELIRSQLAQHDTSLNLTFNRLAAAENGITQIFSSFVFGDDNGVPYLDMSTSESKIKMRLTNTKLSFMQAENELAYFSDNKLYVTR